MSRRKNKSFEHDDTTEPEELKAKNMTFYEVLGVKPDALAGDIKKKFRQLAITYHPDHNETGDASIFALVARAYECLSNEQKRSEYNKMLLIEKKTRKLDFISQRKAFEEFIKAQDNEVSSKSIDHAKSKFKIDFDDMDRKRGVDRSEIDIVLAPEDAFKRMKDMQMAREQDEIEFAQPKIFDKSNFDRNKFNSLFELKYRNESDDQIIKHGIPSAFNDVGASSFISCEGPYDDIFDERDDISGTDLYGSIKDTGKTVEVTKDDIKKTKGYKNAYSTHNSIEHDYHEEMAKRLREREMEDKLYEDRKMQDYDKDDKMGGYGFLHEVGLTGNELECDDLDEVAIEKLIAFRQLDEKQTKHKNKKH